MVFNNALVRKLGHTFATISQDSCHNEIMTFKDKRFDSQILCCTFKTKFLNLSYKNISRCKIIVLAITDVFDVCVWVVHLNVQRRKRYEIFSRTCCFNAIRASSLTKPWM